MTCERFDRFVERRLYGPEGFYTSGGQAGRRRGDFITSPEVGPLFGEVMVNACLQWWEEMGRPEPFTVVDLGTGPGTLLRSMTSAIQGRSGDDGLRSWSLVGVDRAGPHTGDQLPERLDNTVVIGNELLDNVPFRILEIGDGQLHEVYVVDGLEQLKPVGAGDVAVDRVMALPGVDDLVPGTRLPLLEGANTLMLELLERHPGRVCMLDYGVESTAVLARRGGWLRAYRQHERVEDFYQELSACDITTDIAVDQLPAAPMVESQADFLLRYGIQSLVEEGRRYWSEHAAKPDVLALKMRSRVSEADALCDASGLGSWLVAVW